MMQDIFFTASRPFYQSVSLLKLGPIDPVEYESFVMGFFDRAGIIITSESILSVYKLLEGQTWYIQAVFNEIYALSLSGDTVDNSLISLAIKNIVLSYEPIYQGILSRLTERQKEILFAIANEGYAVEITSSEFVNKHGLQSSSSVQSSIKQLITKEIVVRQNNRYLIPDRFFALWLRMTYGTGWRLEL